MILEIRSSIEQLVNSDWGENLYSFGYGNFFSGFYFPDLEGFGYGIAEDISLKISEITPDLRSGIITDKPDLNNKRGIVYHTQGEIMGFRCSSWGNYLVSPFFGDLYWVAYHVESALYKLSKESSNSKGFLLREILNDKKDLGKFLRGDTIYLAEGYAVFFSNIWEAEFGGEYHVALDFLKDDKIIASDEKICHVPYENEEEDSVEERTFVYRNENQVIIALCIKKLSWKEGGFGSFYIEGIWQISDCPIDLRPGSQFGKLQLIDSPKMDQKKIRVEMEFQNVDNSITLSKNKDIHLMANFYLKTSHQENISAYNPLKFCIYRRYDKPGEYEVRGEKYDLDPNLDIAQWTQRNFSGFLDLIFDFGIDWYKLPTSPEECLSLNLSNITTTTAKLAGDTDVPGVIYTTIGCYCSFDFPRWGYYQVIPFFGDKCLTSYYHDSLLVQHNTSFKEQCRTVDAVLLMHRS